MGAETDIEDGGGLVKPTIEKELREQLDRLALEKQRLVLEFARALAGMSPCRGVPGESLSRFGGAKGRPIPENDIWVAAGAGSTV